MKKISLLALAFLLLAGLHSCKRSQKTEEALSDDRVSGLALTDATTDEVIGTVESFFTGYHARSSSPGSHLPSCVAVTRIGIGDTITVTWEFDASGCQMPNGRIYTGTVTMQRIHHGGQSQVNVTFSDDFSVDSIDVDGSFQRTRTRTNSNGNPETTVVFDLQISRPGGESFHTTGQRVREMVEGSDTRRPDDNVWEITGQWQTVYDNGDSYDVQTLTPLRKEFACPWYVSGTVAIVYNGETYRLDYGDGTCDDEAVLTMPDGQTRVIHLR